MAVSVLVGYLQDHCTGETVRGHLHQDTERKNSHVERLYSPAEFEGRQAQSGKREADKIIPGEIKL